MADGMRAQDLKLDQSITTKTRDSNNGGSTSTNRGLNNNHTGRNSVQTRFSKLNFPKFEGENPIGRIYKCDRFFNINGIVQEQKVEMVSIHLEGHALKWFQGYEVGHENINWESFSTYVVARFSPSAYDRPVGQLTKLKQTTIVKAYQEQFEALMAGTKGLPEDFFVQCFISGLKDAIKNQVTMFQPNILTQAIGLALLQEGAI
ncbi:hypothetical protein AB3S75_019589 [Citrus x aurantiifolia]